MTPRATLAADRFSADQLTLQVSTSVDPAVFNLGAYHPFIDQMARGRDFQRDAIEAALRFVCGGRYANAADLARDSYANSPDLQRRYANEDALVDALHFPNMLSASLDLATGTGKSYVLYALARIMLNEGLVTRVLVLCPSLTIEQGLLDKFNDLTSQTDLTDLLPARPGGARIPDIVDARSTVSEGAICIENIHAVHDGTRSSSILDSFEGQGSATLVLSDEVHHVFAPQGAAEKVWAKFIGDPKFGFRYHVGASGTCYTGNEYLPDVIYRYSIRQAIDEGWVKEVFYLKEDDSGSEGEKFQKLRARHEASRKTYTGVKPLTIAVTSSIKEADALGSKLVDFLAGEVKGKRAAAERQVLVVTSDKKHAKNVRKLRTVDSSGSPVEWIVSVAMLSEGWDVKNVFQIYPHERKAFNSKLLISQVLGRGLRRPEGLAGTPTVYVFNHQKWGPEVEELVTEVLDQETTICQRPVADRPVPHFDLHALTYTQVPTGIEAQEVKRPKQIRKLSLLPQSGAAEDTVFVSATDATRTDVQTTQIVERVVPVDVVVAVVRERLLAHDKQTGGNLAKVYPKTKVKKLIQDAYNRLGLPCTEVSEENRQRILSAFGSLRQKTVRPGAILQTTPSGLDVISTEDMGVVRGRISAITSTLGVYYDEESAELGTSDDAAALSKALDIVDVPTYLQEVPNSFDFKSPVNVVLTSHVPEREFVRRLVRAPNAAKLASWVKAPDVGFYGIEFAFQRNGNGRSTRGTFNPDFFLLHAERDEVLVVETKANDDISPINAGKLAHALDYFATVNDLLKKEKHTRRFSFHIISPTDYDRFFEALRENQLDKFTSGLQAALKP
jgi:type III restriction enzyme